MQSKNILINAKAYPPDVGGVQSYSEFIARAYLTAGYAPVVVSIFEGRKGWHERSYPEGKVMVLNLGLGPQPLVFAKMLLATAWLRLTRRFAFLHPTTWRPALAVRPWQGRTPMVLTVHGQEVLNYPPVLKSSMVRALLAADLVITVSHATMEVAKGVLFGARTRGAWEVDFNGLSYIDEARAFSRPPRVPGAPLRIVSFARLAERKNIQGCLRALARLRDEGVTNFRYIAAGDGPMRKELEQMVDDLGLGDYVTMAGYVKDEDIPNLFRNTDIFLHPQTAGTGCDLEGFGLAIADSISFGAAAIVGKDGGPRDFVKHGERGLVVDGNKLDEIVDALRLLLTDEATLDRLAAEGRRWCLDNLSWDRHVMQILDHLKTRGLVAGR